MWRSHVSAGFSHALCLPLFTRIHHSTADLTTFPKTHSHKNIQEPLITNCTHLNSAHTMSVMTTKAFVFVCP